MKLFLFCVLIFALISLSFGERKTCNHRDYDNGGTVCVCSHKLGCDNLPVISANGTIGSIEIYCTSRAGDRMTRRTAKFSASPKNHNNNTVRIEIGNRDNLSKSPRILGFGGAFTDATGYNIAKLPQSLQRRLISDYFAADGAEYRLGRIPIGGSDFSTRAYSYDDNHPEDVTLKMFALQSEDFDYKLPYLHMAQQVSEHQLRFFGSPWSPPAWMKTNGELNHGGFLKGEPGTKYYKLFARYFVRFLQEYERNNISLWGLTVENEPQMGYNPHYAFNSLGFNGSTERDFVKLDLAPELRAAGFGNLSLMIYDDNIERLIAGKLHNMSEFVSTVFADTEAAKQVAGVAFHWYGTGPDSRRQLDELAAKFPDKFFLSTEACEMWVGKKRKVSLGNWATFDRYAEDIIRDLEHHTSGWVDWNMALDLDGGPNWVNNFVDSPIIVNGTGAEYYKQPTFYALAHFGKFLLPDSRRVMIEMESKNVTDNEVLVTVFERPDRSTVMTVLNKRDQVTPIVIHDRREGRGYSAIDLPARSLQSIVWY